MIPAAIGAKMAEEFSMRCALLLGLRVEAQRILAGGFSTRREDQSVSSWASIDAESLGGFR